VDEAEASIEIDWSLGGWVVGWSIMLLQASSPTLDIVTCFRGNCFFQMGRRWRGSSASRSDCPGSRRGLRKGTTYEPAIHDMHKRARLQQNPYNLGIAPPNLLRAHRCGWKTYRRTAMECETRREGSQTRSGRLHANHPEPRSESEIPAGPVT
jgi:hypothetical protein